MKHNTNARLLRVISILCAVLAAVLQAVAVFTDFTTESNYFTSGAFCPTAAIVSVLVGTLCGIVSALLTDADKLNTTVFRSRTASMPATIGCFTAAVFSLIYASKAATKQLQTLALIAGIFLLLGTLYCLASGLPALRRRTNLTVFLGLFAVLGSILLIAYYYFDTSLEMNAPFKLTTQMGLLCVMLYFTGELRFLLGTQKPRLFLALCTTLFSVGSLCSLSLLAAFFADKTDRGDYTVGALLVLCTMLNAAIRMRILLSPATPTEEAPTEETPTEEALTEETTEPTESTEVDP